MFLSCCLFVKFLFYQFWLLSRTKATIEIVPFEAQLPITAHIFLEIREWKILLILYQLLSNSFELSASAQCRPHETFRLDENFAIVYKLKFLVNTTFHDFKYDSNANIFYLSMNSLFSFIETKRVPFFYGVKNWWLRSWL